MYSSGSRTWRERESGGGGGYPSWRLMVHWWFMKAMGEYATWTGVRVEVSAILGLELGFEPFHWEILLPYSCSRFIQNMLPRVWWILGNQRVGEVGLTHLTCRWIMSTNLFPQGEVLGLVTLGHLRITHWIGSVITGSLGNG